MHKRNNELQIVRGRPGQATPALPHLIGTAVVSAIPSIESKKFIDDVAKMKVLSGMQFSNRCIFF